MDIGENRAARTTILWLSIALMLLPIAYFYKSLFVDIVDIPYADDYAILGFLNVFTQMKGFGSHLVYLITAQHNEYKLIFENAIVVAQYYLIGHTNFAALIVIGSIFILLTFLLIFRMFYRSGSDIAITAGVFVPCAYLLFQLQYASALDWALTSLQYMPAIFFALLTIWLLSLDTVPMFYGGCISLGLSIASSGNGFFVVPVGVLLLLQNKRYSRVVAWTLVTIACTVVYFWRYNFHASPTSGGGAVLHGMHVVNVLYTLSFLGASCSGANSTVPSIVFGTMLVGVFFYSVWKRYYRTNPAVFYSMLFILITAFGVAYLRSDSGLLQSLASRYRMFSNLYLVFVYLFAVDVASHARFPEAVKLTSLGTAFLLTVAFAVMSNSIGHKFIHERTVSLVREMANWEHPKSAVMSEDTNDLGPISGVIQRHKELNLYRPEGAILTRAIELGTYTPPAY